ncbi:MAG TPA: four helix bundle protein [Vicinamibacterales bacterium]|nr:four helix bundle protein [Vicinamibacterales bacterium]
MSLPHKHLAVWQRADDLFIDVHQLTLQRFPAHERFELGSQLRRAAWSVPSNIVEGIARSSRRDSLRFFDVSASSLSEVGYGLHAARRLGYIDEIALTAFEEQVRLVAGPLHGLIRRYRLRGALATSTGVLAVVIVLAGTLL